MVTNQQEKTGFALAKEDWIALIKDDPKALVVALYMGLVGYGVLVGIPVIATAWATKLGFSEIEVGRVAGMDLGGLSFGAVIAAWMINRVNRRLLVVIGILIATTANIMCLKYVDYDQVLWLRLAAGFGSGIYSSVAIAVFGMSVRPALAYNLMLFSFAFSQALEMRFLPTLSMNGIYWVFIVCFLATLPFVPWLQSEAKTGPSDKGSTPEISSPRFPSYLPWICLGAIFLTYVNIGSYWTYIELAALEGGTNAEFVGSVLIWVSLCSFLGCLVATLLSNRFGLLRPLLVALSTTTLCVAILIFGVSEAKFLASVLIFNLVWIFTDVYQMGSLANFDHGGRYSAYLPAAQGFGQMVGPNISASLLGANLGYSGVFAFCASATLLALIVYGWLYLHLSKQYPDMAEAT